MTKSTHKNIRPRLGANNHVIRTDSRCVNSDECTEKGEDYKSRTHGTYVFWHVALPVVAIEAKYGVLLTVEEVRDAAERKARDVERGDGASLAAAARRRR